ncbi:MAG: DUF488 family protein [Candidatus Tectomicrobia bacterium]|uniref:DUF488 family protein n=1 Tax=Tectimicrobiota bacterium TaxID=2528274 RepID=A0A932MNI8_UNCTE|nr:DUF488 family protein [Candidatus Tectomicrobia bacterium]
MPIRLKRAYEPPSPGDGLRVLVDRVWPRGLTKDEARIDLWLKDAAPSTPLRKWFAHDPGKWPGFQRRYKAELRREPARSALAELKRLAREHKTVTLVFGAKDEKRNQAVVIKGLLGGV